MRTSSKALSFGKTELRHISAAFIINFHARVFYACAVARIRKILVLGADGYGKDAAAAVALARKMVS